MGSLGGEIRRIFIMKKGLHPEYHRIAVRLTDGTTFETRSTWGKEGDELRLEVDPLSHPAWTGGTQKLIEAGQLSRFRKRFGGFNKLGKES